jgi:hypothetical protein
MVLPIHHRRHRQPQQQQQWWWWCPTYLVVNNNNNNKKERRMMGPMIQQQQHHHSPVKGNRIILVVMMKVLRKRIILLVVLGLIVVLAVAALTSIRLDRATATTTATTTTTTTAAAVISTPPHLGDTSPDITSNHHHDENEGRPVSIIELYHSVIQHLLQQQQQRIPLSQQQNHTTTTSKQILLSLTQRLPPNHHHDDDDTWMASVEPITLFSNTDDITSTTNISWTVSSMVDILPYCDIRTIINKHQTHPSSSSRNSSNNSVCDDDDDDDPNHNSSGHMVMQWLDQHLSQIVPTNIINMTKYVDTFVQQIQKQLLLIKLLPTKPQSLPHVLVRQHLRTTIQQELYLQLLEQYMTMKFPKYCNYTAYFHETTSRYIQPQPSLMKMTMTPDATTVPTASSSLSTYMDETRDELLNRNRTTATIDSAFRTLSSSSQLHIVYIISTYKDIIHLQSLLDAIVSIPNQHNYDQSRSRTTTILLHIDQYTSTEYHDDIQAMIASRYNYPTTTSSVSTGSIPSIRNNTPYHIHIVQSDIVIYRTDSISLVNYKILYYMTIIWKYQYDYVVLCDGLSYPLVSAEEFRHVLSSNPDRTVYLGQLLHNGQRVQPPEEAQQQPATALFLHRLYSKRLILAAQIYITNRDDTAAEEVNTTAATTTTTIPIKLHLRLPKSLYPIPSSLQQQHNDPVYQNFKAHMNYKSTSGNQGIYSYSVIHQLVNSPKVQELFLLSKYSCCCCIEEHNWIAALHIIDLKNKTNDDNRPRFEVHDTDLTVNRLNPSTGIDRRGIFFDAYYRPTAMFQLWGGISTKCQGTMSNAILSMNRDPPVCYRSEDPYHSWYTKDHESNHRKMTRAPSTDENTTILLDNYKNQNNNYFYSSELWDVLFHAKHYRQAIMARKLTALTNDTASYQHLLREIQAKLWHYRRTNISCNSACNTPKYYVAARS